MEGEGQLYPALPACLSLQGLSSSQKLQDAEGKRPALAPVLHCAQNLQSPRVFIFFSFSFLAMPCSFRDLSS